MRDPPEHLTALAGGDSRRAVVIANAVDDAPAEVRPAGVERERRRQRERAMPWRRQKSPAHAAR
jgi:hypothetical protein